MPVTQRGSITVKRVWSCLSPLETIFALCLLLPLVMPKIANWTVAIKSHSLSLSPLLRNGKCIQLLISMFYNYRGYKCSSPMPLINGSVPDFFFLILFLSDIAAAVQLQRSNTREEEEWGIKRMCKRSVHLDLLSRNINRILIPDLLSPNSKFNEPQWMFLGVSLRACLTPATL